MNSDTCTNPTKSHPAEDTDEEKLRGNHSTSMAKDFQTRLHATPFVPKGMRCRSQCMCHFVLGLMKLDFQVRAMNALIPAANTVPATAPGMVGMFLHGDPSSLAVSAAVFPQVTLQPLPIAASSDCPSSDASPMMVTAYSRTGSLYLTASSTSTP